MLLLHLKKENNTNDNTNKILPELIDGEKKEFFCKYTFKYIISSIEYKKLLEFKRTSLLLSYSF